MNMLKWTLMLNVLAMALFFTSCEDEANDPPAADPILLDCRFADNDTTLTDNPDAPVDYIIDCSVSVRGDLTIEPGVVIHFRTNAGLNVLRDAGTIIANGTAAKRIVLEGENPVPGQWRGIYMGSTSVLSKLSYVDIRHGGGEAFNSNDDKANIIIAPLARLTLDNVTCSNSETYGLTAPYNDFKLEVTNSTFTSNALEPVLVRTTEVDGLDGTNDFTGNGNDVVKVTTRRIDDAAVWKKLNVPYFLTGGPDRVQSIDGSLTLEPGVEIVFDADCGIAVSDGFFKAEGSATEPILFTGLTKQPGAWKGLLFRTDNLQNRLDYVTIEYTGSGEFNSNGDIGAIIVWADSYLSLTNSTLRSSSADCAINAPYNDEDVIQANNTITGFVSNYCDQ